MRFSTGLLLFCSWISTGVNSLNGKDRSSKISLPNSEQLDGDGNVWLAWEVDFVTEIITFEIEAKTTGYVGFGISPNGGMVGADIFIAGVANNGTTYYSDRFGIGSSEPKIDTHEDWTLINATEANGVTYLKFSRVLNTCDDEDYPITSDTNRLIWAMGASDVIEYHTPSRRGTRSLNLLNKMPHINTDEMYLWEMTVDMVIPAIDTTYWCSFHKGLNLQNKHHIVAFDAVLENFEALKHTHRFTIYNCFLPANSTLTLDEVFGPYIGALGSMCNGPNSYNITQYCTENLFVWAKGGKRMVFPEKVGYPIAEGSDSYYMLEIHYDNPEQIEGVQFKAGAQIFYTDKLREMEAGLLAVGHVIDVSLTVPPNTEDFVVVGHCSANCTELLHEEGIDVFNVLMNSHISGKKLKLRHFRDGQELPWIDFDDHYDFDYQQNKHLAEEIKILPGDQIIYECTYSSKWKNEEIVSGGYTIRNEICQSFLWYYPRVNNLKRCSSQYPLQQHFSELGVTKWSINADTGYPIFNIDEPAALQGDYDYSMSYKFNWTNEFIKKYAEDRRYGGHTAYCSSERLDESLIIIPNQKYPENFTEFIPEDECSGHTTEGPSTTNIPSTTDQSSPQCPDGYNGLVPHPIYCAFFYFCNNGHAELLECPPGLYYNPSKFTCDFEEAVPNCEGGTRPPTTTSPTPIIILNN